MSKIPFVLVIVLVGLIVNWPSGAGFKADDYPAIAYASQFQNCLHDFHASQYGLTFFLFYRPFITLSLYVDQLLFGTEAFGYLLMNCLACICAALLLFAIVSTLVRTRLGLIAAFSLAVLWICHPVLVTSLRWVTICGPKK